MYMQVIGDCQEVLYQFGEHSRSVPARAPALLLELTGGPANALCSFRAELAMKTRATPKAGDKLYVSLAFAVVKDWEGNVIDSTGSRYAASRSSQAARAPCT
jgi:hypothetical protein